MKNIKLRYYLRGLGIGVLVTAFIMGTVGKEEAAMTDAQIRERASELGMVDGGSVVLSDLRNTAEGAVQDTSENNEDVSGQETDAEDSGAETMNMEERDAEAADETGTDESDSEVTNTEAADTDTEEADSEATNTEVTDAETADETGTDESDSEVKNAETADGTDTEESGAETMNTEATDIEETDTAPEEAAGSESRVENGIAYFEIVYGESSNSVSRVLAELGLVADAAAFDNYLCSNGYSKRIHTGNYAIAVGTGEEEIAKIITGNR